MKSPVSGILNDDNITQKGTGKPMSDDSVQRYYALYDEVERYPAAKIGADQ
jgi:hypothetical protein